MPRKYKSKKSGSATNLVFFPATYIADIFICLDDTGKIIEFNPSAENTYDLKKNEVVGKNFVKLCKQNNFNYPPQLNQLRLFIQQKKIQELTNTIINKSNQSHSVAWKIIPRMQNKSSQIFLIGKDITLQKIAEKDIKNIEKRLESVIESIAGNHWWKDINGRYMGCNETVAKSLGLNSAEEIVGKTDYDLPWANTANELIKNDQEVIASGVAQKKEEHVTTKDGKILTFLVTKVPLRDENGIIIGTIGTSVDITAQKNAQVQMQIAKEKAESLNRVKSEFIANMSHDLRTPLSGVLGISELLEKRVPEREKEMAQEIMRASKALLNLLNEIIEYIKIETDSSPLHHDQFEIRKIITEIVDLMLPSAKQRGLELFTSIDEAIPKYLVGDATRTHRILLNLVSNAVKFTKKGHVAIRIKLSKQLRKDVILKLIIEDTGIGIPENQVDQIFTRFTRLTSASQEIFEGAGLGLSIVKQFIKEMNGEIYVESQVNKGSKFICVLSFKKSLLNEQIVTNKKNMFMNRSEQIVNQLDKEKRRILPSTPADLSSSKDQPVLLLIEDDSLAQKIAKLNLEELNCIVDIASSGEQAINMFRQKNYDLVIVDIGLPDMDGYSIAKALRKFALKYIPIIALTAQMDSENRERCLQAGIDEVLLKPLMLESAQNILHTYFKKKAYNI